MLPPSTLSEDEVEEQHDAHLERLPIDCRSQDGCELRGEGNGAACRINHAIWILWERLERVSASCRAFRRVTTMLVLEEVRQEGAAEQCCQALFQVEARWTGEEERVCDGHREHVGQIIHLLIGDMAGPGAPNHDGESPLASPLRRADVRAHAVPSARNRLNQAATEDQVGDVPGTRAAEVWCRRAGVVGDPVDQCRERRLTEP